MTIKAQIATIQIGPLSMEGLMSECGRFYIGLSQLVDIGIIPQNRSIQQIQSLFDMSIQFIKLQTPLNSKEINAITLDQLFQISLVWYNKKPEKPRLDLCLGLSDYLGVDTEFLRLLHTHNKHKGPRGNTKQEEKNIQLAYQTRLGGKTEYPTPMGRIDLLTEDSLYEFKHYSKFKEAVGQVLMYKRYVSIKYLYIVLFGCPKNFKYSSLYTEMLSSCEDYGIKLRIMS